MSDFTFEEDPEWQKLQSNSYWNEAEHMPILVRLLMKTGMARRTSYYVLFGILVVCSFATFEIIRSNFFPSGSGAPTYLEDIPEEIRQTLPPEILKQIPSRDAK
ncbi:MAG: hypothetical protein Q7S34_03590 [bacterium]|nr:hypothetical protein [bacterium]